MRDITRRAVIQKSLGLAAAGTLVRPYISRAAATTAEVWWPQGFIPEEDTALKKAVADYEKASGNQIDLNIAPFAPQRQKIVAAVTSGVVPDIFRSSPDEAVALFAWEDMLVDVSDVVETQKEEFSETALLNTYCYNQLTKQRAFYGVPDVATACPNHVWRSLVEKAGYKIEDIPKTWDVYYDFFKDVQKKAARTAGAQRLRPGLSGDHKRQRPQSAVQLFPDRLWRPEHHHQGWQAAPRRPAGEGSRDHGSRIRGERLQRGLCAAERAQLERRRRQQRLSRQDHRHGPRRHHLDRGCGVVAGKKEDYDEIVTMGLPLSNDGKPVPSYAVGACAVIPKGAKNVEVAKELLKYLVQPLVTQRAAEDRAWPQYSEHAVDREERPLVV